MVLTGISWWCSRALPSVGGGTGGALCYPARPAAVFLFLGFKPTTEVLGQVQLLFPRAVPLSAVPQPPTVPFACASSPSGSSFWKLLWFLPVFP